MRIDNVNRCRCIVLGLRAILRGDEQLFDAMKLCRRIDGVSAFFEHGTDRELRQGRGRGVDTFRRGLEPAGNFLVAEGLQRVQFEYYKAQVAAIGAPDSQAVRIEREGTAIRIQRQSRLVGFRSEMQRDEVRELALGSMMLPGEDLSGWAAQFGKRFPKPWRRTHGLLEKAVQAAALRMGRRH